MNKEINYNYKLPPFKWFCLTNFPFIEADFDALTYYELLCKVVQYLNEVIVKTNAIGEQTEELTNAFNTLKEYVDTYFDNLDVQEEINNKLDEMAESGELEEIISQYLNSTAIFGFDTVNDMLNAPNLIDGSYARTFGFYSINDGGNALYKIRNRTFDDVVDNMTIFEMSDNTLVAELIFNKLKINSKKIGVYGDKIHDDTTNLQNAINLCKSLNATLEINGVCKVNNTIELKGIKIIGVGKPSMGSITYTSKTYGYIGWDYLRNVNNGALITFTDYLDDYVNSGSAIVSDTANPIVRCDYSDGFINLENIAIVGWLRNATQIGIKTSYDSQTYLPGKHILKNVNVFNCGNDGIQLNSLENVEWVDVESSYNFGYGLHVIGDDTIDTPFEYVHFNRCKFKGNKLGGVNIYHCYRKNTTFEFCDFSASGLYVQLGITLPTDITNIISGVKIVGKNASAPNIQSNLEFNDCFSEEIQNMIYIDNNVNNVPFNNISIHGCTMYSYVGSTYAKLLYLNVSYCRYFSMYDNFLNNADEVEFSNTIGYIIPLTVDFNYYKNYRNVPTLNINSKLNVSTNIIRREGDLILIKVIGTATSDIAVRETMISNMPLVQDSTPFECYVNNTPKQFMAYVNGIVQNLDAITTGQVVFMDLIYYAEPGTLKR